MNGAPTSWASRRAISVLPTPVGPIMMMFLGVTSLRRSGGSCCRRQRLRIATATARLAASCPTMYRSNSATICRGVRLIMAPLDLPRRKAEAMRYCPWPTKSDFDDFDVSIRIDANIGGDFQAGSDDLGGAKTALLSKGAGRRQCIRAARTDGR